MKSIMKGFIKRECASKRINQGIMKAIEKKTRNANKIMHSHYQKLFEKIKRFNEKECLIVNFKKYIFIALTMHDKKYT
jgi:hypothetical protein